MVFSSKFIVRLTNNFPLLRKANITLSWLDFINASYSVLTSDFLFWPNSIIKLFLTIFSLGSDKDLKQSTKINKKEILGLLIENLTISSKI